MPNGSPSLLISSSFTSFLSRVSNPCYTYSIENRRPNFITGTRSIGVNTARDSVTFAPLHIQSYKRETHRLLEVGKQTIGLKMKSKYKFQVCFVEFFINNMSGTPVHRYDRFCTQRAWVFRHRQKYNYFYRSCQTLDYTVKHMRF